MSNHSHLPCERTCSQRWWTWDGAIHCSHSQQGKNKLFLKNILFANQKRYVFDPPPFQLLCFLDSLRYCLVCLFKHHHSFIWTSLQVPDFLCAWRLPILSVTRQWCMGKMTKPMTKTTTTHTDFCFIFRRKPLVRTSNLVFLQWKKAGHQAFSWVWKLNTLLGETEVWAIYWTTVVSLWRFGCTAFVFILFPFWFCPCDHCTGSDVRCNFSILPRYGFRGTSARCELALILECVQSVVGVIIQVKNK